jgi:membrane-associated phospholipid phosphatase
MTQTIARERSVSEEKTQPLKRPRRFGRGWIVGALILSALTIVAYFQWDARVVHWVHDSCLDKATKQWVWVRKLKVIWPGHFLCTLVIAALVAIYHRTGGRGAMVLLLAGILTGANSVIKWFAGRSRPDWKTGEPGMTFHPFRGGLRGLFQQENLAFPSGDAALADASAAVLTYLIPRWAVAWWAMALVVAGQRVAENAHHVSDVLAAGALGLVAFHCARAACRLSPDDVAGRPDAPAEFTGPDRRIEIAPPDPMNDKPYLSLVIPCYNEEENVPTLLTRVEAALRLTGKSFEVVIVDDGSTDSTPKLLAAAMAQKPWLRVLRMAKNGGQSAAFEAGFEAARGDVIATIDADLQNDPEEIPRLLPMLDEQHVDMITGWRKDRQDTPFRRWQSRQANRIRNWISKETVNDSASSLKLYRAPAIKGLRLFNGAHRFFPTLVKMRGFTVHETPVKHSVRFAGTAKYGFRNRAFRAFIDLIGVRWMKERCLRYQATEVRPGNDGH